MNSENYSRVLIIGCGWVGKKLGVHLHGKNIVVYGTTRSSSNFSELKACNIQPVKLEVPVTSLSEIRLPEVDSVIISLAPGRGEQRSKYPTALRQIAEVLKSTETQVIMYSSTSAYGDLMGEVTESKAEPDPKSDNILLAAEGNLLEFCSDAVILRLCGLYGDDRHPAKYLGGRKDVPGGDRPVNLVHRDDVIQVTERILSKNIRGEIFNVCSNCHPTRNEIYTKIAERLELKPPVFLHGGEDGKIIVSKKVEDRFGITFTDPNDFLNS